MNRGVGLRGQIPLPPMHTTCAPPGPAGRLPEPIAPQRVAPASWRARARARAAHALRICWATCCAHATRRPATAPPGRCGVRPGVSSQRYRPCSGGRWSRDVESRAIRLALDMAHEGPSLPESARLEAIAATPRPRAPTRYDQPPRLLPAVEPDWRRIFGAIRRRRWVVLGVTLLGTVAGVVAAAKFVGPRYLAGARLWVGAAEPDPNAIRGTTPAPGAERLLGVEAWVDFVRSHAVLDTVVREVRLYLSPKTPIDGTALLGLRLKDQVLPGRYRLEVDRDGQAFALFSEGVVQRGERGDSVGPALGVAWVPGAAVLTPGRRIEFTLLTPHDAAELLASQLQVTTDREGTFVTVQLTGTDPQLTAAIVKGVADRTVAVAADLRRHKVAALADILGQQVQHAQASLTVAELALKNFRVRAAGALPAGVAAPPPSPAFTNAFELRGAVDQHGRDRQAIHRGRAQAPQSGLSGGALAR